VTKLIVTQRINTSPPRQSRADQPDHDGSPLKAPRLTLVGLPVCDDPEEACWLRCTHIFIPVPRRDTIMNHGSSTNRSPLAVADSAVERAVCCAGGMCQPQILGSRKDRDDMSDAS
jgi:hypothetical protein